MKSIYCTLLAGASLAALTTHSPAVASPHVYTNMVLGINNLKACLDQAAKVARQNGFTRNIEITGSGTMQDFHADHNDMPMAVTVSCSTRLGGAAIAVAGMNNNDTFNAMKKFYLDF